jgi:hypothetical protein
MNTSCCALLFSCCVYEYTRCVLNTLEHVRSGGKVTSLGVIFVYQEKEQYLPVLSPPLLISMFQVGNRDAAIMIDLESHQWNFYSIRLPLL